LARKFQLHTQHGLLRFSRAFTACMLWLGITTTKTTPISKSVTQFMGANDNVSHRVHAHNGLENTPCNSNANLEASKARLFFPCFDLRVLQNNHKQLQTKLN
jgi:hypothetical protein